MGELKPRMSCLIGTRSMRSAVKAKVSPWHFHDLFSGKHNFIPDLGTTKVQLRNGYFPCVTATRASGFASFILHKLRFVNLTEYMRIQGLDPMTPKIAAKVTNRGLGHAIGNGVHVDVVNCLAGGTAKVALPLLPICPSV